MENNIEQNISGISSMSTLLFSVHPRISRHRNGIGALHIRLHSETKGGGADRGAPREETSSRCCFCTHNRDKKEYIFQIPIYPRTRLTSPSSPSIRDLQ